MGGRNTVRISTVVRKETAGRSEDVRWLPALWVACCLVRAYWPLYRSFTAPIIAAPHTSLASLADIVRRSSSSLASPSTMIQLSRAEGAAQEDRGDGVAGFVVGEDFEAAGSHGMCSAV